MADLEFTRQDIEDLIRKVSTLQPYFSDKERQLLMAIFGVAAERAKPLGAAQAATLPEAVTPGGQGGAPGGQASLADLQQQLLQAYVPGNSFDTVTGGGRTPSIHEPLVSHSIHRAAGMTPAAAAAAEPEAPAAADSPAEGGTESPPKPKKG